MSQPTEEGLGPRPSGGSADRLSETPSIVGQKPPEMSLSSPVPAPAESDAHPVLHELQMKPRRVVRRWKLPLFLFVATCLSTFWAGAAGINAAAILEGLPAIARASLNWQAGLVYMAAVLGILLAHEMGHFLVAARHRILTSYPLFIPMPLTPLGTMGAVIAMDGSQADRRQLFDIGIAGPLAGLVVAIPVVCVGVMQARAVEYSGPVTFHDPLLIQALVHWLRPEVGDLGLEMSPLLMAGWVGLLVTGLNMLPISQLDGGHITYAIFGNKAHLLARLLVLVAVSFIVITGNYSWIIMLLLIAVIGIDHPPTRDDTVPLGRTRFALGLASLIIPVLCFPPLGISVMD